MSRIGWLREAEPGANDGIVSNASPIVDVAAASHDKGAAMIAGAVSVAAGE